MRKISTKSKVPGWLEAQTAATIPRGLFMGLKQGQGVPTALEIRGSKASPMFPSVCSKPFLLFCLLLLVGILSYSSDACPQPPGRPLRVVMDNNYPPYAFLDSQGNLQGILIDQWRLWEQKTGISVSISGMDWNTALRRMEAGEFDVIDTIFFNEKRDKIYEFSQPYARLEVPIFFHRDISGIAGVDSLQGFVVAVKAGDAAVDFLRAKGIDRLEEFSSYEEIIQAAQERKVMTFVIDAPPALYFLSKMGLQKEFHHTDPLYVGEFHRAVRKGNTALMGRVESGFKAISENEYRRINRRWFGISADYGLYLRYAAIMAMVAAVLLTLLILWNVLLRRTVTQKTARLRDEVSLSNIRAEALRESEEKYRTLVESIGDVIFEIDTRGILTYVSPVVRDLWGYDPAQITGRSYLEFAHPEDHKRLGGLFSSDHKDMNTPMEFRLFDRAGDVRWVRMKIRPTIIQDRFAGVRGTIIDITDSKQADEERIRLQERLGRAEKIETLGMLAGGVAHDLNNVLGILIGYSEFLLDELPAESPLKPYATKIMDGGQRATAIIQDLLTLTRRGVIVSEVININDSVSHFWETAEFQVLRSHHPEVVFESVLDPLLLNIKGSPVHLSKTLINLVSNAAESISGPGKVTIRTENRYVDRPLPGYEETREGEYAVLCVSDTGSGIPTADIKRIFEPFYTKKVMGRSGTGLGLTVVWGTVKDHHGYIDVQSSIGQGSTFILYWPVSREGMKEKPETGCCEDYRGKGERILVVDDVEGQRILASFILSHLGYEVHTVAGGEEAVAFLTQNPTDLLVLDMIMDPGIDGLETYRRILQIHPDQKAVIVSGFAEDERVKTAQQLGAGVFIRKPYLREVIGLAVRRELDRTNRNEAL